MKEPLKGLILVLLFTMALSHQTFAQTFAQGYEDGFREGKEFALANDYSTYTIILASYLDYPNRFPGYPQNFDYFAGKAWGILEGWTAYFVPPAAGPDLRDLRDPLNPPYNPHDN